MIQGQGIASYLLGALERIAGENGYSAFSASVLSENTAMLHVFKKRYPHMKTVVYDGSEIVCEMAFEKPADLDSLATEA